MGTSRSYGGPGDTSPLLPSWATNPAPPNGGPSPPLPDNPNVPPQAPPLQQNPVSTRPWTAARRALSRAVSSPGRANWQRAARRYVAARGGSRRAATTSAAGRRATARIGSFVGGVAQRGFDATLHNFGLQNLIGSDIVTVVAAIANAVCPSGGSADDAVARQSTIEVLAWLFDKYAAADDGIARLEHIGEPQLAEAITESVARYIFNRWLEELGKKIEEKAVSPEQAPRIERDVLDFVRESVKLNFADQPLIGIDWQSPSASQLIESIYGDAYRMLE